MKIKFDHGLIVTPVKRWETRYSVLVDIGISRGARVIQTILTPHFEMRR
jgi:hypothetical protein